MGQVTKYYCDVCFGELAGGKRDTRPVFEETVEGDRHGVYFGRIIEALNSRHYDYGLCCAGCKDRLRDAVSNVVGEARERMAKR